MIHISQITNNRVYNAPAAKAKGKRHIGFFIVLLIIMSIITAAAVLFLIKSTEVQSPNSQSNHFYTTEYSYRVVKEIQNAPLLSQMPELPSGCEATVAAMLLQWAGVKVSKEDIAKALPKGPVPVMKDGLLYGGNPNDAFIGDPFSSRGFGVYHKPISAIINSFVKEGSEDITGIPFEGMLKVIDDGRPVMVWATLDLQQPELYAVWYDEDNNKVEWLVPEHAFLLTGYSDTDIIVNDPYSGKRESYPVQLFKSNWEAMGRQAVTVSYKIRGKVVETRIGEQSKKVVPMEQSVEPVGKPIKQEKSIYREVEKVVEELTRAAGMLVDKIKKVIE